MRLNLIFGFLGSGKTTLVRRILAERGTDAPTAVIVNEFGDVGIDGDILEGQSIDMIQLTSGCLCCTLKGALSSAIKELHERAGVERTVVEASGLAEPSDTLESLADPRFGAGVPIDLGPVVAVVDAPKFPKIREMLGEFYTEQVVHADVVLLNKIDRADAAELDAVHAAVAGLNPAASLLFTEHCDADLSLVLDGPGHAGRPGHSHSHHHHEQFDSLVLPADADTGLDAVERFFGGLDAEVLRAKGFMTIDGAPRLVQFATGALDIHPATEPQGRHMVFIGRNMDRQALAEGFRFARTPESDIKRNNEPDFEPDKGSPQP